MPIYRTNWVVCFQWVSKSDFKSDVFLPVKKDCDWFELWFQVVG